LLASWGHSERFASCLYKAGNDESSPSLLFVELPVNLDEMWAMNGGHDLRQDLKERAPCLTRQDREQGIALRLGSALVHKDLYRAIALVEGSRPVNIRRPLEPA